MEPPPEAPPEARLIDEAQKSATPKISARKAAALAGLSEGRWRQIVKGYQSTGTGYIPVIAPDETLARMAAAVGVTADELVDAGRENAAALISVAVSAESRDSTAITPFVFAATSKVSEVQAAGVLTAIADDPRLTQELRRRIAGDLESYLDKFYPAFDAALRAVASDRGLRVNPNDDAVVNVAKTAAVAAYTRTTAIMHEYGELLRTGAPLSRAQLDHILFGDRFLESAQAAGAYEQSLRQAQAQRAGTHLPDEVLADPESYGLAANRGEKGAPDVDTDSEDGA